MTPGSGDLQATAFSDETVLERLQSGSRAPADGPSWPLREVELLAPIPEPRIFFCLGRNYAAHAEEAGHSAPEKPMLFLKPGSASTGPGGDVRIPAVAEKLDYEAELAVVMGANSGIAGYAVADDVSARDLQRTEPLWVRGKGADTFCPWGPWITTADEVPEPENLRIRCWVNDELRQDGNTSQLIFGLAEIIAFIGETCQLRPGDVILTGTPEGVGFAMDPPRFLGPGDRVRAEIEGLGSIEHGVRR